MCREKAGVFAAASQWFEQTCGFHRISTFGKPSQHRRERRYRIAFHSRKRSLVAYISISQEKQTGHPRQYPPTVGPVSGVARPARQTNPANCMTAYKPSSRYLLLLAFAAVIVAGTFALFEGNLSGPDRRSNANFSGSSALYSPTEDLEGPDINLLNSARATIDIAMYAFTDERIESSLVAAARRGVKIRIYRDSLQFEDEEARASKWRKSSITDVLKTIPGIAIRVKARGKSMHLKSYCVDRSLLRTGSANWSPDGELVQDNDFYVIRDAAIVEKYESDFDSMWDRGSNISP